MKEALIIFAKAPLVGQVKTRLMGALTPEQATELYVCFLQDTFAMMEAVQMEREQLSLVLCYTPADEIEAFEAADLDGCLLLAQRGQDMGERLANCCADLLSSGFHSLVILGADSPTVQPEVVYEAFEQLAQPSALVVGPATDGGYYLLGLNQLYPELFAQINWSSPDVLAQTQARAATLQLTVSLLPAGLDIDTPADLESLQQQIADGTAAPPKTTRYLKKMLTKR